MTPVSKRSSPQADQPSEQLKVVGEEDDDEEMPMEEDPEAGISSDLLAKMKEEGVDWAAEAVGYC